MKRWWLGSCAIAWAGAAAGQAVLPTGHSGPWSNLALLPAGWTQTELTDYAVNYDGFGGGAAKFDSTNDALRIDLSGTPEEVTYWIQHNVASGYVFQVEESVDGEEWSAVATYAGVGLPAVAQPRTNRLLAASRHVRFRYETKTIGNVGLDGVDIRGWPTNFCVTFNRRDGFSVQTGTVVAVVATARNGAEPCEMAWDSTLGAEHWSASGDTFTIEASAPRGDYVAWASATDSGEPIQAATNSVRFAVTTVYAIVLAPATHGMLATEPAGYAAGGETVLVLDAPEAGYQLASLTVEPDGEEPFHLNGGRFAMPATATTVRAVFEEIPPAGSYVVDFEDADKFTYPTTNVVLNGKKWELAQTLIGTASEDVIAGFKSARLRDGTNAPSLTLLEDLTNGLGRLSFKYRAAALTAGVHYGVSNATVAVWTVPGARQWLRLYLVPLP